MSGSSQAAEPAAGGTDAAAPAPTPRQRREKMVRDAEQETRDLMLEIEQQRKEGLVRRRWYEVLRASFG